MLCITATHPIQYQAPLFRLLASELKLPLHVIFGSDFSLQGYFDKEFKTTFAWDTDLTSGYSHSFLSHVKDQGAKNYDQVNAVGLGEAIDRIAPTAVLALGYSHPFDRDALRHARKRGIPLMLRAETSDVASQRSILKRFARDLMLRNLYRRIAAFLYIGTHSKAHYQRLGVPENRLWFSPYAVDTSPHALDNTSQALNRSQERASRGWLDDDVVLLCSGKLFAKKGQDLLLAAVAKLDQKQRARTVVALLGDGEARQALADQANAISNLRVHFYGFKNQREISAIYAAADIAVQPSRAGETWGLVVNEAMLHGLPVIASSLVGSAIDLIVPDKTGQIVPSDDVDSLAAALRREIERRPRHEASASRGMANTFSLPHAAQGILAAYEAVKAQVKL